MKKTGFFLMLSLIAFGAFAQSITVVERTTLQPVEGIVITGKGSKSAFITDKNGKADISALKNSDSISVKGLGYLSITYSYKQLEKEKFVAGIAATSYNMNEVVISANKFEEKKTDIPNQIQVISERDIAFANQSTTADLLQQKGDIMVQKSQMGGGSAIIRGFEANKVLMVVDGVRMNNAIYRGGHLQNSITLDNGVLEKVEIVYGPGSVVYGSDALGGVMHFYTKQPQLSDLARKTVVNGQVMTRYASANSEGTGNFGLNFGGRKLALFTAFTFSDFNHLRQGNVRNDFYGDFGKRKFFATRINGTDTMVANNNVNIQVRSAYRQNDFIAKLLYKPNERYAHLINIQNSSSSDIPRYDKLTDADSAGNLTTAEWYYGPQKRLLASYQLNLSAANLLWDNARITLAYQNLIESRHTRAFGSNKLNHREENVKVYSANLDMEKGISEMELRYGIEFSTNKIGSTASQEDIVTGSTAPLNTRYPNGSSMNTMAAYVSNSWEINPELIFSQGLRYSLVSMKADFDTSLFSLPVTSIEQSNGALNGNLGLVYLPGNDWKVSALASSGFRAANVDDLAKVFESQAGNVIVPNPDLKPEYTYTFEAGLGKTFNQQVRAEISGFYTFYEDAIVTRDFTLNGVDSIMYDGKMSKVTANTNAARAYIYGTSASVAADITSAFAITSSLTYTYGRVRATPDDVPLDHIPPVFGRTGLNFQLKKFRSEFFVQYNGWKRLKDYSGSGEDNLQYATAFGMPAWYTINIRTAYQLNKFLQVQAALENMLDQNYRVFASGISAPGRNLVLTLRGSF